MAEILSEGTKPEQRQVIPGDCKEDWLKDKPTDRCENIGN